MSAVTLLEGITLGALTERVQGGLDLAGVLGQTPVLLFRPQRDEDESPVYTTPTEGEPLADLHPGDTSAYDRAQTQAIASSMRRAVVVPLTPSNRNLLEDQILIGRHPSNDVRLISPTVSKVHCRLQFDEGRWSLADEDSSNGTTLNGMPVAPGRAYGLRPGDEVVLGDVSSVFLDSEGLLDLVSIL